MPVEQLPGKILLRHPKGAVAEILLYGATVVSWRSPSLEDDELKEILFLSSKAILDGTKAVRGGIPVVFPCFGPPQHPDHLRLAQHGFARTSTWALDKVVLDDEAGVSVKLVLNNTSTSSIGVVYDKPYELAYVVTLAQHQLSTDIHVKNTGDTEVLEFQSLLHTYLRAPAKEVAVTPLQGLSYYDKTEATLAAQQSPKLETRTEVDVRQITDSVYENAPLDYTVSWPAGIVKVRAKGFKDLVVWNPGEEGRAIGDLEEGGWDHYICVEPGYVRGFVALPPGETWIGQQVITIEK